MLNRAGPGPGRADGVWMIPLEDGDDDGKDEALGQNPEMH